MSLINRMLQDLDKRGSGAVSDTMLYANTRAVQDQTQANKSRKVWWVSLLAVTLVMASACAATVWVMLRPSTPVVPVIAIAKPVVVTPPAPLAPLIPLVKAPTLSDASLDPDPLALFTKDPVVVFVGPPPVEAPIEPVATVVTKAPELKSAPLRASQTKTGSPVAAAKIATPPLAVSTSREVREPKDSKDSSADYDSKVLRQAKEVTPDQSVDNAYRKALSLIYAKQLPQAFEVLTQVLQSNPKHAAARQALVGLLLENKREDDAITTLKEGLSIDLAQPDMAMILARLQAGRGSVPTALITLERTLPYAQEKADYHAFLAVLLQHEKRHKEAAEQYAFALNKVPDNGLWWMGYGISLQADQRPSEAIAAYTRANASTSLTAELRVFVNQKLSQLQH